MKKYEDVLKATSHVVSKDDVGVGPTSVKKRSSTIDTYCENGGLTGVWSKNDILEEIHDLEKRLRCGLSGVNWKKEPKVVLSCHHKILLQEAIRTQKLALGDLYHAKRYIT